MATLLCLMYHNISAKPVRDKYALAYETFKNHLEMIRQQELTCITTAALVRPDQKEKVMISFDDGWSGNWSLAAPLLQQFGLPATFFITTNFIGTPGYMTWEQIKGLQAQGFDIQSHTHTHVLLSEASEEKIKEELKISKEVIESKLGASVRALSLPGGRGLHQVKKVLRSSGYDYVFTSVPGVTRMNKDVWRYKRMLIKKDMAAAEFQKMLTGNHLYFAKEKILYALKGGLKFALGTNRYYTFWRKYYKE